MKKIITIVCLSLQVCFADAATYYVATDGNDANNGSKQSPFATMQHAQDKVHPGDTVYIRGGIYKMNESQIAKQEGVYACVTYLDKSGERGKYISYFAYPGEKPVFDYADIKPVDKRVTAFCVRGSWLHFKGFEVTGVQVTIKVHTQSECFRNFGSNNVYEQLSMHDGMAIGFYLLGGANNLVLNCDAYRNWDYFSEDGRGGNTDGFGSHPAKGGSGNVFKGCRAWFNSDDGYDVINSQEATSFDSCWAFYNGLSSDFKNRGDGNGFKGGGYGKTPVDKLPVPIPQMTIKNCIAVGNKASGFYSNHHINGSFWYNNKAYRNSTNYNMLNRLPDNVTDVPGYNHVLENNIGYKGRQDVANLDETKCTLKNNVFTGLSDKDFQSLDEKQLVLPRKENGSLPDITFLVSQRTQR